MRKGYTPIVIKKTRRAEYYDAIDHAHTTFDYLPFIKLICEFVLESENL